VVTIVSGLAELLLIVPGVDEGTRVAARAILTDEDVPQDA
jgi:hypothetical protein